jgi:hypothetical protein
MPLVRGVNRRWQRRAVRFAERRRRPLHGLVGMLRPAQLPERRLLPAPRIVPSAFCIVLPLTPEGRPARSRGQGKAKPFPPSGAVALCAPRATTTIMSSTGGIPARCQRIFVRDNRASSAIWRTPGTNPSAARLKGVDRRCAPVRPDELACIDVAVVLQFGLSAARGRAARAARQ